MKQRKLTISQCMIVKNEEENIERALSWGRDIFAEQIVVDTGSTDRTLELAKKMGAKVYIFPWIDDFSAAKNYAIEQAVGDWIAFLDADEYVKLEDAGKVLSLLEKAEESGFYAVRTTMLNVDLSDALISYIRQTRFFKRMSSIRYEGCIHEQLWMNSRSMDARIMEASEDVVIYHTGYAAKIKEKKKKTERNIRLLLKALEKTPEDYHIMGDLGDAYLGIQGGEPEAERWYREAICRIPKTSAAQCDRNVKTFLMLMRITYDRKDEKELLKLYQDVCSRFVGLHDPDYYVGKFYVEIGRDYQKGAFHLERAIRMLEQYGTNTYGSSMMKDIPGTWELLAECCYENGELRKCVTYCVSLLKADKSRLKALEILLNALAGENSGSVVQFLGKLYDFEVVEEKEFVLLACNNVSAVDVMNILKIDYK